MISFVILHYNSIDDTIKCIDSILSNSISEDISIIVVDNKSVDFGGQYINKKYHNNKKVEVIFNQENNGFSKGNNIGCNYAIKKYLPDFICVFNNDIYLVDSDFIKKIRNVYTETNFDVLGPTIWNIQRSFNHNPFPVNSTLEEINTELQSIEISEKLLNSKVPYLYYLYNRFRKTDKKREDSLHGSALIFSRKYYKRYSNVFPEYTFMYGEESLLNFRRNIDKLKFHYEPSMRVYHNHSASTNRSSKNVIEKWKFQSKYMKIALLQQKKVYEKNEKI